ncbi:PrgI family protein [Viridibacillus arvi]|uniref:PrgI family protein n=1 Tax=Viridibacillus arvi TaxID=263475 RepID=UPI0034CE9B36
MRKVNVPVDMSSEQKAILGIMSIRQLIYVVASGALLYAYVPFIFSLMGSISTTVKIIACLISALPIIAIVLPLAFIRKRNYHMFLDYYLLIKFRAKTQHGIWRKGSKPKKWMEEL